MLNNWNKDFTVVNETQDFKILLNPTYSPFEKDVFSFYLVYKEFNTVEACANSIIVIHSFLEEAQEAYDNMLARQKRDAELSSVPTNNDENMVH